MSVGKPKSGDEMDYMSDSQKNQIERHVESVVKNGKFKVEKGKVIIDQPTLRNLQTGPINFKSKKQVDWHEECVRTSLIKLIQKAKLEN